MPKTDFVDAYSKTTGKLQRIPKSWLDRKDAPFTDFTLTPPETKAAEPAAEESKPARAATQKGAK